MKVIPVAGGLVRDPRTRARVTEAVEVPDNDFYWLIRIAHGDVTLEEPEPAGEAVDEPAGAPANQPAPPAPDQQS
jgi:hypothetical protein